MKRKSQNKLRRLAYGGKPIIFTKDNIRALEKLSLILSRFSGRKR